MEITAEALTAKIPEAKRFLRAQIPNFESTLAALEESIAEEAQAIAAQHRRGESVVPEIQYADILNNKVPAAQISLLKTRGACVVRNVFPRAQVDAWNEEAVRYIESNNYYERAKEKAELDTYFATLASDKPQIFGLYWSKPQVMARQSIELARTRAFLNSMWHSGSSSENAEFDAHRETTYADRIRRREPGNATLGLSLHMDGGSIERWVEPSFQRVYRKVFDGDWKNYDPWDATGRTQTREIPSPAVCRMFRTYCSGTIYL